ncbi:MAG: hypothetical protein ACLS7Z_01410 [Christensenellales bacterium]
MPSKRDAMTARALALVGCGYIYGATGWICTRARMEQQMRQYPTYAGQIERYGKKWIGKPCWRLRPTDAGRGAARRGQPAQRGDEPNGARRESGRKRT